MDEVVVVGVVYQAGRAHEVRDGPDPLGGLAQVVRGLLENGFFVVRLEEIAERGK